MEWLNPFGLVFMAVIMIPNIIYAAKYKDNLINKEPNKVVAIIEQIGRYGCFVLMIFNIPGTWFGWWSDEALALYLIVNTTLVILYLSAWIIGFKKQPMLRAVLLSALPSILFIFSSVMSRSVLLFVSALLFAPAHILISCQNTALEK